MYRECSARVSATGDDDDDHSAHSECAVHMFGSDTAVTYELKAFIVLCNRLNVCDKNENRKLYKCLVGRSGTNEKLDVMHCGLGC